LDTASELALARAAIDAVAKHIRDAGWSPDDLDTRLDTAIDDYLAPPSRDNGDGTVTAIDDDGFIVQRGRKRETVTERVIREHQLAETHDTTPTLRREPPTRDDSIGGVWPAVRR